MAFNDRYGYDKDLGENGAWVQKDNDFWIKIRRLRSKKVREVSTKLNKPYAHITRGGKQLPDEVADRINRELIAKAILVDWKGEDGPRTDSGDLIPFSEENAIEVFIRMPDFMDEIVSDSDMIENFRQSEKEEIEGNS